ncbi:hypothetical protein [Kineosporia sp. A_224]|uniref:hypothetical protein n=1 Tax=Kineosporia sp. A_224 TaxID=1962180 RepID=UPI001304541D|nr:hypothetical protein [Kineosporia sp. A_224]
MRRAGLTVVRWDAKDVLNPAAAATLTAYLRSELSLRTDRPYTATVTPHPFRHPG